MHKFEEQVREEHINLELDRVSSIRKEGEIFRARALVHKPEIYIFDDSFSALDYRTDARLRAALRKETADATVIVVGQRVSTVMDADQIIVLDKGQIVGMGKHKELMQTCEVYREIVSSQLSEEEIA